MSSLTFAVVVVVDVVDVLRGAIHNFALRCSTVSLLKAIAL
jgi:hypothetical protein